MMWESLNMLSENKWYGSFSFKRNCGAVLVGKFGVEQVEESQISTAKW